MIGDYHKLNQGVALIAAAVPDVMSSLKEANMAFGAGMCQLIW